MEGPLVHSNSFAPYQMSLSSDSNLEVDGMIANDWIDSAIESNTFGGYAMNVTYFMMPDISRLSMDITTPDDAMDQDDLMNDVTISSDPISIPANDSPLEGPPATEYTTNDITPVRQPVTS